MNSYAYQAINAAGLQIEGTLDVASQSEALRRIKEMGLFPTKVAEKRRVFQSRASGRSTFLARLRSGLLPLLGHKVRPVDVTIFTRQLATLIDAGMPLLRGLRVLRQQEENRALKQIVLSIDEKIESGCLLSEALAQHPKVFNALYINMVRAGEIAGVLELTLRRLAEFMEKAQKIKNKVKAAMFYPMAVMFVAGAILAIMMLFVVPRFKQVFDGLMGGAAMPVFTTFILHLSDLVRHHAGYVVVGLIFICSFFAVGLKTNAGRLFFDRFKLAAPILGPVFRKVAISRFARTLGTLLGSGVPILQALTIVRETVGNVVVGQAVSAVHDNVKEGETIATTLKTSKVFPPMIVGMVDVGEQTGALPDMLLKIADNCDDDVDNAVSSMTAVLEPIMIVLLAIIVGCIVIALFLPLIRIIEGGINPGGGVGDV